MTKKVDVAIQSYKKPESLIYSLLTLHRHCKEIVEEVWINDDKSGGNLLEIYRSPEVKAALSPWKINVRENERRMGWWLSFVWGYKPKYLSVFYMLFRMAWNFYKNKTFFVKTDDIRYQWAIQNTNKEFLFLMHDDITFKENIIDCYLKSAQQLSRPAIVGDLGQCWRCSYAESGCNPQKILSGFRPSARWPMTKISAADHKWACRINEWSALINVSAAKEIQTKHRIFFGNYDDQGDLSAYWFSKIVEEGFDFDDPVNQNLKDEFYLHWEDGKTGHSVWVDQGKGKSTYDTDLIRKGLLDQFNFNWIWN